MPGGMTTRHITLKAVAAYCDRRLPDAQEARIERYFAECERCPNRARQYYAFTELWHQWTAKAHGEAYRRAVLFEVHGKVPDHIAAPSAIDKQNT